MAVDGMPKAPAEPRSISEIFADLRVVCHAPGALHAVSTIIDRDWFIVVDLHGNVTHDEDRRWSRSRLNNNELLLLMGLIVQSPTDQTISVVQPGNTLVEAMDKLLEEFHDTLTHAMMPIGNLQAANFQEKMGSSAREAIYYGADSAYIHQYKHFSRLRYKLDSEWLLQNAGFSIRPMIDIARFIIERVNRQMTVSVAIAEESGAIRGPGDLTNSLIIAKKDIVKRFGHKAEEFLKRFSTPATNANKNFIDPFSLNLVNLAPLIDLGDVVYVCNQYRLFETIYESPFYWMLSDLKYSDTASDHRGQFLESTAAHLLAKVFGKDNVHKNVIIRRNRREIAGEADVLVAYGEFVLIVQAKSKRVTMKARAGDIEALNEDFASAIQTPYRQAYDFAQLIQNGAECVTQTGTILTFPDVVRTFPVVILSDSFPSVTLLSSRMLKCTDEISPVIWDIAVLDCVTGILPHPVDLIFYLKCRSDNFQKISADSEFNYLGYHLKHKLAMDDDFDFLYIERDFAAEVDDFMISKDVGRQAEPPKGVIGTISIPVMSDLLNKLKDAPPELASVAIDLFDFSSAALQDLGQQVVQLRGEVSQGKAFKSISILTESGGLTYLVCQRFNPNIKEAAQEIGAKHKYDSGRDRWYVLVDDISTKLTIDAMLPIREKWQPSEEKERRSAEVGRIFKSRQEQRTIGAARSKLSSGESDRDRHEG